MPKAMILDIFSQLVAGMQHCHEHNVMHRDLKPNNIFLHKENGKTLVKIGDFGCSKTIDSENVHNTIIGTIVYLPPE